MYPLKLKALKVSQPIGEFYVAVIPAKTLLSVCHSVKTEILEGVEEVSNGSIGKFVDKLKGTQRDRKPNRLAAIKEYSETVDACFPNSVILGANFTESGLCVSDEAKKWTVESDGDCYTLTIPSGQKLASIIDGQHRIFGLKESNAKSMDLVCSIFIDLPMAYQAQIFTKINTTQKRVDKNLAYNLFQFDMAQGDSKTWGPETLAVYFSRVLSEDKTSPLHGVLKLGVSGISSDSSISMASVIDGIVSMISSSPDKDRNALHSVSLENGRSRSLLTEVKCSAPLRDLYLRNQDKTLYDLFVNFFSAIEKTYWNKNRVVSIFKKTLGIQALLDFLKELIKVKGYSNEYTEDFFIEILSSTGGIDFNDPFFGVQSKVRSRIKNILLVTSGHSKIDDLRISEADKKEFIRILG